MRETKRNERQEAAMKTRISLVAAAAIGTLTLLAPAAALAQGNSQKDPIVVGTDEGKYDNDNGNGPGNGKGYSGRKVGDLHLGVLLSDGHQPKGNGKDKDLGLDQIELRYYTPKGFLYMSQVVPIAQQGSKEKDRQLPGYHFATTVRQAKKYTHSDGKSYGDVDVNLPVGGTAITTYSVFGSWRVEVWQAGQLIATRNVTIQE